MNLTHEGYLSKDAETKTFTSGKSATSFSIAYNPGKKEDNKPAIWFNFKAVGSASEFMQGKKKGSKVKVTSAIPESWKDASGNERITWTVFGVEGAEESKPERRQSPPAPTPFDDVEDDLPF
jgi:single-stranded DNA-binding protein